MPKFPDTILLVHASPLINAEQFVLLYDLHTPKNPDLPYTDYECFDVDKMTDDLKRCYERVVSNMEPPSH